MPSITSELRFGLFEAANWIGEILSRNEDKGKELPEAEFVSWAWYGSGCRVALQSQAKAAQNKEQGWLLGLKR